MAANSLPEPMTLAEWKQKVQDLCSNRRHLKFDDLVEIARYSPALRIAFDSEWQTLMNRDSRVEYYRQEIFKLHGIDPFFFDEPTDCSSQYSLEGILADSLDDADIWDAATYVISEIVRDEHPLLPESREWASGVISGYYTRPAVPRGPHPLKHDARNTMVVAYLFELSKHGISITENEAKYQGQSACHAISAALGGFFTVPSPKTLMNIWSDRSQNWKTISGND